MPNNNNNKIFWIRVGLLVCTAALAFIASLFLIEAIANKTIEWFVSIVIVILIISVSFSVIFLIVLSAKKLSDQVSEMNLELKKANVELSQNKKSVFDLSTVVSNLHQAVVIVDNKDSITWVNDSFEELFGFKREETLGHKVSELIAGPETDQTQIKKMDEAIFQKKEPITVKLIHYRKDKTMFWSRVEITPLLDKNGNLEKYIAVSTDISDEYNTELKLIQSEANFDQITSTINSVTFLYNINESQYEFISENCIKVLGVEDKYFYNGNSYTNQFVHPDDKEFVLAAKTDVEDGKPYSIEYRVIVNNEVKWIKEESFPIMNNMANRNSGICTDITQQKNDQEDLIKTHNESQRLTEIMVKTNAELELKNKEIKDSISYAQRIQRATLTDVGPKSKLFPSSFVIYKPKDVVSGDFYRLDFIRTSNGITLNGFIVGDCTGHGVPGAILSILCSSLIRQTLTNHDIHSVGDALNNVRDNLQDLFNTYSNREFISDGMDAGFGVIDEATKMLYYSGANMDCYILRNDEVIRIRGDRQHVGYDQNPIPFETQSYQLLVGDVLYVSTDGFMDQFGGEKSKKFGSKQLTQVLKASSLLPMNEREKFINDIHVEWQGEEEQTDDICLLGIEVE